MVQVVEQELTEVYQECQQLKEKDGTQSSPWTWDWNAEIAQNSDNIDENFSTAENRSTGILRNSINRQDTYGLISKLNYVVNPELELQFGLDWRTAGIEHAREVRDLLRW